ncbi:MAG: BPSS1780 family membrane protein [Polaromonas sp.]|uniref:BPSS1780 family membrane protein n=1 Tax=Polaromonas sp. TaxID=1869339 RepID=UPI00272F48FF|nr:BPSS1780 family membrane protein [Polaromonas sp.]MDP1740327.1 BPSS1780 family membrane protein [Polaromonas sp.]MDP1955457.1 BPSS1780 family membrane protein [Polaromonas sp.]MDP3357411.1 BPSS1780 family membrane protein [Polaromonas sp.]MDP3753205.1 BPSS1780 family membrane protein [Polaromonas sp.]
MKLNIVPARTGITWVKLGIQTFLKQPLALAGLFFMYMAAATLASLIPYIGVVLALAIVPAATLGLMAATQEATKGKFPMPAILVSAFRAGQQRARAMLVLGFLYAAACLLIVSIVPLFLDVPVSRESALAPEMQGVMLVVMLMYLPVSVLFWHAPALVHWHGVTPVKSLFFSAVVCFKNAGAYTLFGLAWMVVLVVVGLVVSMLAGMLASPEAAAALVMPAALLMAAMFSTSIYFTFTGSFDATPPDDTDGNVITPGDTP